MMKCQLLELTALGIFVFISCCSLVDPAQCQTLIDEQLLKKLETEAADAWASVVEKRTELRASNQSYLRENESRIHRRQSSDTLRFEHNKYHNFHLNSEHRKQFIVDEVRKTESVLGYNPQYAFHIERPIGADDWAVILVINRNETPDKFPDTYNPANIVARVSGHWTPDDWLFIVPWERSSLLELPGLDISAIRAVEHNGRDAVEVVFEYLHGALLTNPKTGSVERFKKPAECRAVVDPDLSWALLHLEFHWTFDFGPGARSSDSLRVLEQEFEVGPNGIPFVTKRKLVSTNHGEISIDQDLLQKTTTPRFSHREFTLSHYGLPEPDWYRHPPPYWLYVSVAGMILVVNGALLIRYGKSLWRRG